jgi:magnesium and cobalt transporter
VPLAPRLERRELIGLLRQAEREGTLDPDTELTLEGALSVADMKVRDIMVPRVEMVVLEEDTGLNLMLPIIVESLHSRFPVVDEKHEHVLGILLAKDLLPYLCPDPSSTRRFALRDLLRPPVFVPESKRLPILLREFRTGRNHMAVVVDEYGIYAGLVTIEDVIEQIVGEIDDEHDVNEENPIRPLDRHFAIKARTPVAEFNAYFHAHLPEADHDTVGGLILHQLGRVPEPGERVDLSGFCFEVVRADARHILTLRLLRGGGGEDLGMEAS